MKKHRTRTTRSDICMIFFFIFLAFSISRAEDSTARAWNNGNFRFLEESSDHYLVRYLYDFVMINCSTTDTSAISTLFVTMQYAAYPKEENIEQSLIFNDTLRKAKQNYIFTANTNQAHAKFRCKAQARNHTIWADRGTLLVRPEIRVVPVELIPNITSISMEKGSSFEISCQASGKGHLSISYLKWFKINKTGEYLVDPRMVHRKANGLLDVEVFRLKNITKDFEGVYKCTRQIGKGPVTSASFRLVVEDAKEPIVVLRPNVKTLSVVENQKSVLLECIVLQASPKPTISWYKDTAQIKSCSFSLNCSLEIKKLKHPVDDGTYTCIARNTEGTHNASVLLSVSEPNARIGQSITKANNKRVIALAVSCSAIVILVVLLIAYVFNRRLKRKYKLYLKTFENFVLDDRLSLNEQSHRLPYEPRWEFPREKIQLIEPIGRGAFGEVWLANAQGILEFKATTGNISPVKMKRLSRVFSFTSNYHNFDTLSNASSTKVAVKTLKDNATETDYKDLASELKILIHIGEHQNIVNLLGACTRGRTLMVILEYCVYGDLSNFLRGKRDIFEPSWVKNDISFEQSCTYFDLANITYQIARGMDYLSSKKCIHRDLAARNILVSKDHNQDYVYKIADFGMARDVYKEGIYAKESSGVLPLKWTAPESLADAVYTSQSDVWAFGVVLWEIFTLGGSPYPGIATDEFLTYLKAKKRMEKPECCPDEFYQLMVDCWNDEPERRPTFSKLFELITDIIENLADTNATYLRLESGEAKSENDFAFGVKENIGATQDSEIVVLNGCRESLELVYIKDQGPGCGGYQNLGIVKNKKATQSDIAKADEYVPMINGDINDENENVLPV